MSRIADFKRMVSEGRFGFKMDETMSGEHRFEPGMGPEGRFPFEFTATWGPEKVGPWINPFGDGFMKQPLSGTVTMGGLCQKSPCTGTLELNYFTEGTIRYSFDFTTGGVTYRYIGEKVNIRPWNLPVSHTTCFGTVVEAESGRLVSRSVTHFRMKTAPAFLASMRLA
jgi:hypothetical protein